MALNFTRDLTQVTDLSQYNQNPNSIGRLLLGLTQSQKSCLVDIKQALVASSQVDPTGSTTDMLSLNAVLSYLSNSLQGLQGVEGDPGANGTAGVQGLTGAQGIDGAQGINGALGTQGTQGVLGLQGLQGIQGVKSTTKGLQGAQGLQGLQGISSSLEIIAQQLIAPLAALGFTFYDSNGAEITSTSTNFTVASVTYAHNIDVNDTVHATGFYYK